MRFMKNLKKLSCVLLCLPVAPAVAQDYPNKPIEIVVPYRASGTPDLLTRIIAEKLTAQYGQAVIVHNKPGASGVIAAQEVLSAPADGYKLFVADNGTLAINPNLNKALRYDPLKDFKPITQIVSQPFFIFAHTKLGVTDLKQLIDQARKNPGKINYASVGNGSPHHLCMSMLTHMADIELTHIPFKGISEASSSIVAGDVELVCTSPVGAKTMMDRGVGVELAINSAQRSSVKPNVPTFAESSGLDPLIVGATIGILAKTGTPDNIINKVSADIQKVLQDPEVKKRIEDLDMSIIADGPDAYAQTMQEEYKRYGEMVKISGAQLD